MKILQYSETRMSSTIEALVSSLSGIRAGVPSANLVAPIKVKVYNNWFPIKEIALISVPNLAQIIIRPHDIGTIKDIEKAILTSDLGLNPQSDNRVIRINVPPLSTEVRRKLVGRVKYLAEEAKVAIRNIRRDANKKANQEEKDKEISEDQCNNIKDQIQQITKKYEEKINSLVLEKERSIWN